MLDFFLFSVGTAAVALLTLTAVELAVRSAYRRVQRYLFQHR